MVVLKINQLIKDDLDRNSGSSFLVRFHKTQFHNCSFLNALVELAVFLWI